MFAPIDISQMHAEIARLTARQDAMESELNGLCLALIAVGVATDKPGQQMGEMLRTAMLMPSATVRERAVLMRLAEIFEAGEPEALDA